jgi:transglutaminase-like putative cysteine protease
VIDPQSLSPVAMEIEIVGAEKVPVKGGEIEATRVRRTVGGAVFDAWLDPEGRTLRETGPLGISFVREDPRESAGKRLRTGRDLVESASIPVSRDIPDQETLSSLSIRLSGADTARLAAEGGRQSLSGGVLTVVKESLNPAAAVRLPVTDPRFAEYLRPSTLIESDRPEISAAARKAAGGETGALAAALRISDWLFENIAKKNVAGVPDALATLRNMEGDCNEHTYLFVAMARSLGIPARVNAGIACLRGRFYYHAWPEVWAGTWVTLDPTWGQAPADVTHIRLVQGEGSKLADILGLFGKLKVEVVSWR